MKNRELMIAIASRRFPPAEGGVETYLSQLMEAMAGSCAFRVLTQIRGNNPDYPGRDDVFASAGGEDVYDSIPVRTLGPNLLDRIRLLPCGLRIVPGLRRCCYPALRRIAVKRFAAVYEERVTEYFRGASLVHSYSFGGLGLCAWKAARTLKVPFIITPFAHPGKWGDDPFDVELYDSSDRVIALHAQDKDHLISIGVKPEKIRIVSIGIRPFAGDGAAFRAKHGIQGKIVLFVGRLMAHKGFNELIQAAKPLKGLTLVIIGPGEMKQKEQGVQYLGAVSEKEKQDALAACDLFCLPSDSEIFPVSILEAWQAGKPVLVGDIPALRAIVREGKTGVFARRDVNDIESKLSAFLASEKEWRAMGEEGHRNVQEKYLMDRVAEQMAAVYREVLNLS